MRPDARGTGQPPQRPPASAAALTGRRAGARRGARAAPGGPADPRAPRGRRGDRRRGGRQAPPAALRQRPRAALAPHDERGLEAAAGLPRAAARRPVPRALDRPPTWRRSTGARACGCWSPASPCPATCGRPGPDLLDDGRRRRRPRPPARSGRLEPTREVGEALVDQRVVAGMGNVYKSEACFLSRDRPVAAGRQPERARRPPRSARPPRASWPRACATGGPIRTYRPPDAPPGARGAPGSTGGAAGPAAAAARRIRSRGPGRREPDHLLVPRLPALTPASGGWRWGRARVRGARISYDLLVDLGADQQRDAGQEEEDQVDRGAGQRAVDALQPSKFST